jgi:hypothetical protein
MKQEVIQVNKQLKNNEISAEQAKLLKKDIANKYALRIKEKSKVIKTKGNAKKTISIQIGSGNILTVKTKNDSLKNTDGKKDFRTYSGIVIAAGFNNVIQEGRSLNESDYKAAGSRFFELGVGWKTRVFKESNWLRFGYGLSLQINNFKPKDNQYFIRDKELTTLTTYPYDLDKSKIRNTNLVVPISFEFGSSEKIDKGDYFIFSSYQKIKFSIGAYAGVRLSTIQKLKYKAEEDRIKYKKQNHYNMNDFIYGLTAEVARKELGLCFKYDLNPLFSSPNIEQHAISLGLKYELF